MPRTHNKEPDLIVDIMHFITVLAVRGHSTLFTGAGILLLLVYALSLYALKTPPVFVAIMGGGMCAIGLLFFFLAQEKPVGGDAGN